MALLSHFYRKSKFIINPRLILENHNDPDSKKRYFLGRIGRNIHFSLLQRPKRLALVFLVLLLPLSASAGAVGDFFNSIFNNSSGENLLKEKKVQSMALLVSTITPPTDGSNSHIPVVENNALVSDVGILGGASDSLISKPGSDQISVYVVREGDTLSQIAEMYDVTVNTIKWSNDLSSNTLKTGETLVILPISGVKHTVVKGDTLASLAKKYKGDVDEIIAYNNLKNGETLVAGSIVIIPDGEVVIKSSSGSYTNSSGSGLKEYSGYYMRPIIGGKRSQGIHGYNGVDLAAPVGTPIMAAADGVVIISRFGGWNGGYGNYIVVRHSNGTQTLYAHNSKNNVLSGDKVKQGDIIGAIGNTGKSTGPHLHFEIRGAKNPF
ncbi:MAG: peptidoglycan DD-metalloendopeptidase family protein [Patescibacteria group bacterium]